MNKYDEWMIQHLPYERPGYARLELASAYAREAWAAAYATALEEAAKACEEASVSGTACFCAAAIRSLKTA